MQKRNLKGTCVMKKLSGFIALLLVLATVITGTSVPSYAAGNLPYSFKTVSSGKSVRLTTWDRTAYRGVAYKIKVEQEALLQIKTNCTVEKGLNVILYRSKKIDDASYIGQDWIDSKRTASFGVVKGTYYVVITGQDYWEYEYPNIYKKLKATFTVTPQSKYNKLNYCKSKAIDLEKKTWATFVATPNYDYARWYRITLEKPTKIRIGKNSGYNCEVALYNSKNQEMCTYTQVKLPAGTYYLKVPAVNKVSGFSSYGYENAYTKIRWY